MLIGVPAETLPGETRVAVTPETVKKLKAAGHTLRIQSGAGVAASATDEALVAAGAEITDADVTAMLETMRKQRPDFVAVEREAGENDRVTVDFEGRIDGELFQGGSATGFPFVIGQGRMLKEFEDGVRGAKAGEARTVELLLANHRFQECAFCFDEPFAALRMSEQHGEKR
mgnify:CR=1 FL=1